MSLCVFPTSVLEPGIDRVSGEPETLRERQAGPSYASRCRLDAQEVSSAFTNSQWDSEAGVRE